MVNSSENLGLNVRNKVDTKHLLESYIYQKRKTTGAKVKLGNKIDEEEKEKILTALSEAQATINSNEDAKKEDREEHIKESQSICDPVIAKVYKKYGGQVGSDGGFDDEEFGDL